MFNRYNISSTENLNRTEAHLAGVPTESKVDSDTEEARTAQRKRVSPFELTR